MHTPFTQTHIETEAGALPARLYGGGAKRAAPLVLYLHGGAFTDGTLECGAVVASLLAQAGAVVVSIEYPLACEHPFPYALTAAYAALCALHRLRGSFAGKASRLFVAGEQAGGNLAAGLAMMARDQQAPPLAGQILMSPMLDPCLATASARQADAGVAGCRWADGWQKYLGSADKGAHPYAAPLTSARLAGLAPALVVSAQDDPMRDESVRYARALAQAGVPVTLEVLPPTGCRRPDETQDAAGAAGPAPAMPLPALADALRALFAGFLESAWVRRQAAASPVL
ncbi:alpha/beta hydrolase [Xanthobacter sp. AM11]|uniref:alpha/beta hydrolase n=1 Tax=Xanthobacter sp. AM11 TaxID=3380643 RepID=UPI0039BFEF29